MTTAFVSYAQNFEDVMLWRALKHVEHGFYIDVGAFSPSEHSVTLAFYERGWRGINIEPHPAYHREFLSARSRDVNLDVALGDRSGDLMMHFVTETGLSTLDDYEAEKRAREGHTVVRGLVQVARLASIWLEHVAQAQPVHFLKVDVEGFERQVLLGNDWDTCRPWVVVVEATQPTTMEPSHGQWEGILEGAGYLFVYGDGLNRFYVAKEHQDLSAAFRYPPNVFDAFLRVSEVDAIERAKREEMRAATAEAELAAIHATRSWRLTGPLRAIGGWARSVRATVRHR
jgi:FkbM family methyltransferase